MVIIKSIKSNGLVIGVTSRVKCKKNKITGKVREVDFTMYYDYGIDDIGSCIDFLIKQEWWKMRKNTILAEDLGEGLEGGKEKITRLIERHELENDLKALVQQCWNEREEAVRKHRKPRF